VRVLATIVMATSLCCGACGGGGQLSHHAHAREASELCRRQTRHAHATDLPNLDRPHDAARAIERAVERQRVVLAELRDLDPPNVERSAIVRWLALIDQLLDEADLMVQQLRRGDHGAASETAARVAALDARGSELARHNDITPCHFPDVGGQRPG
jgi:hypothetical protein